MKLTKLLFTTLLLLMLGCSRDNYVDPCPSDGCFNIYNSTLNTPADMVLDGVGFEVNSQFTSKYIDYFSMENGNFNFIVKNYKPPVNDIKSSWINTGVVSGENVKALILQDYLYNIMLKNNVDFHKCEDKFFTKFEVTIKENEIDIHKECGDDVVERYMKIAINEKDGFMLKYLLVDFFGEYNHCVKNPEQCLDIQK